MPRVTARRPFNRTIGGFLMYQLFARPFTRRIGLLSTSANGRTARVFDASPTVCKSTNAVFAGPTALVTPTLMILVMALVALFSVACFSPPTGAGPEADTLPGGPEYSAIMVSSDLAMGSNRLVFGLVDRDNAPVNAAEAQVWAVYTHPGETEGVARRTATARFLPWPPEGSNRGVFVANLEFDRAGDATPDHPGLWELVVTATAADGTEIETTTAVRVAGETATPALGEPAPRSVTPTAGATNDLATITSAPTPDPDLYQLSVHQALELGQPLVILFSTPAFCVSATCGPQLEIIGRLKDRYREEANFIHVEVFANPHLIQGDRFSAQRVPAVDEWGLPTEPWTFVVGKDGRISAKFEQFTPEGEIEAALKDAF